MKAMTLKKQNNIDSLEEQRQAILQEIFEVEKVIIGHTRKLKNGLIESLETNYTKMKAELESEISTATTMIQDFEKTVKQLQTVTDASPRQQFVQMKITQKAVGDADQSNGTKALHFSENTELKNYVTSATALGQVMIMVTGHEEPGFRGGGKDWGRGGGGGRFGCRGGRGRGGGRGNGGEWGGGGRGNGGEWGGGGRGWEGRRGGYRGGWGGGGHGDGGGWGGERGGRGGFGRGRSGFWHGSMGRDGFGRGSMG